MTRKPAAIREREERAPEAIVFAREGDRSPRDPRPLKIERGIIPHAEGSALIATGRTRVICTATVEDRVPNWLRGQQRGWVTAEYGMLPRATGERTPGRPFRASISSPVSSAMAGSPASFAAALALSRALSSSVAPVSTGAEAPLSS